MISLALLYSNPRCPGHNDVTARQGHYVDAANVQDAHREMRRRFPSDSRFDVELVKIGGEEVPRTRYA